MRLRSVGQASRRIRPVDRTRRPMLAGAAAGPRRSRSCGKARRGGRLGSIPYAGIVDDSEVDRNRPIKCCDGIHSISHYSPAPAMHDETAWRGGLHIREILTAGALPTKRRDNRCGASDRSQSGGAMQVAIHLVTRLADGRCAVGCRRLRSRCKPSSCRNGLTRRTRTERRWRLPILRRRIQARQTVKSGSGEIRRGGNGRPVDRAHGSGG